MKKSKHQIRIGGTYLWSPEEIIGKDGKTYQVFTTMAFGRGWANKRFFAAVDITPLQVIVLSYFQQEYGKNQCFHVAVRDSMDRDVRPFNKRPYVNKQGKFTVVYESVKFSEVYPVHNLTSEHWLVNQGEGTSFADRYYGKHVIEGILPRGFVGSTTHLLEKNLTRC